MIYAVGDIHGQDQMLRHAIDLIYADGGSNAEIVFLGDYLDRGPDSRAVVQILMDGQAAGKPWHCILGNHDRYMTRFLDNKTVDDSATRSGLFWFNPRLGGDKTMASYGVEALDGAPVDPIHEAALRAVPNDHREWLANLSLTHETEDLFFCHAGVRPDRPLDQQDEEDLLWIREGWLDHKEPLEKLVVHGHTALEHPQHHGNRINLDGGAGYFRPLQPAVFEGQTCSLLTQAGRVKLEPIPDE